MYTTQYHHKNQGSNEKLVIHDSQAKFKLWQSHIVQEKKKQWIVVLSPT